MISLFLRTLRIVAIWVVVATPISVRCCRADTIVFKSGGTLEGQVLKESQDSITFMFGSSVMSIDRSLVAEVRREPLDVNNEAPLGEELLPAWNTTIQRVCSLQWVKGFREIPATVIDDGVLRLVPYKSYRFNQHFELNIYGDPDSPVCVEIGVSGPLARDNAARTKCVQVARSIFTEPKYLSAINSLNSKTGTREIGRVTIEVTPPEAPDAYGGWWISAYREKELDAYRASEKEIEQITAPLSRAVENAVPPPPADAAPSKSTPPSVPPKSDTARDSDSAQWTPDDLTYARPPSRDNQAGGRVYVRGYTRKDGTYVRPHTRRR